MRSPFLSVFSQISSIVFLVLKLFRFIWRVFYWNNTRTRAEQNQQQIQSISIPGRRNWQQEEIDADMDFWYTPAFAPFCVGFFFFCFWQWCWFCCRLVYLPPLRLWYFLCICIKRNVFLCYVLRFANIFTTVFSGAAFIARFPFWPLPHTVAF